MKKILIVLLLIMISSSSTFAVEEINGIYYTFTTTTRTAAVVSGPYAGDVVIPSEIVYDSEVYTVNKIAESAFYENSSLLSIKIPSSIVSIGKDAFYGCSNLKKVYIEDLEAWLKIVFYTKKTSMYGPTSFLNDHSNPLENNADLYINGSKVTELSIPENVKISHYSFYHCTSIEKLTIPSSVTSIGYYAFASCVNLKSIIFEGSGQYYDSFIGCSSLESVFFLGGDFIDIGDANVNGCLAKCENLVKIQLSESMASVDRQASVSMEGYLCKRFPYVQEYILPEGIKHIGSLCFHSCDSLKTISIPSSVESIAAYAFSYCDSLKIVKINDLSAWCKIKFGRTNEFDYGSNPLNNKADLYIDDEKLVKCIIPNDISIINKYTFSGCTSIEELDIPNSVKEISPYSFYGCENLAYVRYPSENITLAGDMFSGCPLLVSAGPYNSGCSIEYGWETNIPNYAFAYIKNLTEVFIPASIQSIGNYVFCNTPVSKVYVDATIPPTLTSSSFGYYDATLFVPGGTYSLYSADYYWKKFNIVELIYIDNVCFADERIDMIAGESKKLDVTITPSNATYQKMYWHSLDSDIADVDENGVVTAIKTGNTRVSASTTDGTDLTIYCDVHVTNPVSQVLLNKSTISIEVGQSAELTATCYPENADDKTLVWLSDDKTIATVEEGTVIGQRLGNTIVRFCSVNGIEGTCEVSVVPTLATSISLSESNTNLNTGESIQLIAEVLPAKATIKDVSWISDDNKVADVDDAGKVTAISNGSTYITAKTKDGTALSAKCKVTVTTLAKHIELNKNSCDLIVGEGTQLLASISPSTTSNQEVSWKSSDENVASVSENGFVKAVSTGRASIIATTTDGTNLEIACLINVTNPVQAVSLNKTYAEIRVGEKLQLSATCFPSNADDKTITWYTGDSSVATVENGVVIGKSLGITTIQANSVNGKEAKCTISVVPTRVANVSLDKTELILNANDTYQLTARVTPVDATNASLVWGSSNDRVATVNGEGIITAIASGTATITASTTDGTKISATCIVTVKTPVTSIFVNPDDVELLIGDQMKLTAACKPSNADNTEVMWRSSNESVADVLAGYVTGKSAGEAIITATTTDGTELSCEVHITVKKHPQTIEWNQNISSISYGGELIELQAIASSGLPIAFTSSDDNVVSIFNMGNAIYLNPGECGSSTITATQVGNYYYESTFVVKEVNVIDPNEIRNIASDNKYIVYSIDGILVGRFTEKEYEMFLKQKSLKGLYIVNGKKTIKGTK